MIHLPGKYLFSLTLLVSLFIVADIKSETGNLDNILLRDRETVGLKESFLKKNDYSTGTILPNFRGMLRRFNIAPTTTQNAFSFSYRSGSDNSAYVASYLYDMNYDLKKYGDLTIQFNTGKVGFAKNYKDYWYVAPRIQWHYSSENVSLHLDINTKPFTYEMGKEPSKTPFINR